MIHIKNVMKKILKNNLGFSLIEIMVSVAILGVFVSLVFGIIFYVNKSSESVKMSSNIKNDVKSVFDFMISNIKEYGMNNSVVYRKTDNCYSNFSCVEASFDNGSTYQRMTFSDTNISRLDFYYSVPSNNSMAIVTVVMSGYIQNSHKENRNFSYQGTIEIKNYIK